MSREIDSRISLGDDCYLNLNGAVLVKDGETKYLTPIAFRLLRYLAERIGEVVPSDDLIIRGWGENTMAQRDELYVFIRQIRIQLEDNPDAPTCLKTVRRKGYVLYARQKQESSSTSSSPTTTM
ncbi:winged helix-turn-helix domain-containing protein [Alicyclobacillus hesperidum]|uniref:winged helix-turn-helix domain-containing protein n=1 Tax=Alicyclobacillus hesperidum TaxID=89784 RepID=UPI00058E2446|nr:helix-turn-helix domain-containing protein [Alicyclobacillus hesperidum]